jgi:hypothetical protein
MADEGAKEQQPFLAVGSTVYAVGGVSIGTVTTLYGQPGRPRWAAVEAESAESSGRLVPLVGAQPRGSDLVIPFSRETVYKSPELKSQVVDAIRDMVAKVLDHYGLDPDRWSEAGSLEAMAGGPLPGPPAGGGDRPPPKAPESDSSDADIPEA